MDSASSNKRIAKNTLFLYTRMMFSMIISLYTSRVILKVLGVDDYGIYQSVGGVVGLLSFLNGALASGSSRFLTYELGTGNIAKLKATFSTVLSAHIIIAFVIAIIAETIGLWFVNTRLIIPPDRLNAALFTYQISIFTAFIQLTQVPYNASIISHEKMGVYAYASIVDVLLKLVIVYFLMIGGWDKLMLYAVLHCIVVVGMALYYRFYCVRHFEETKYRLSLDKNIIKDVMSYSGWHLLANTSIALNNQGGIILLNMFFSPGVVAARAIANQVNMAAYHFITNFRTAVTPQVVKRYASKDYEGSKELLLSSTKYSYYLMLFLALPIFLVAEPLLNLWLGQIPPYSVVFLKLTIVCSLFHVFDMSFYTALYAKGQIRENALISPILGIVCFPIVYVLFTLGFSPETMAWIALFRYAILGLVVKPLLIIRIVDYTFMDILDVFVPCIKVTILSVPFPILLYYYLFEINKIGSLTFFFLLVFASMFAVGITVWRFGLDSTVRTKMVAIVVRTIKKTNK